VETPAPPEAPIRPKCRSEYITTIKEMMLGK